MIHGRNPLALVLAAMLMISGLALTGCDQGPNSGRVSGQVTLDDDPLPNADIMFLPEEGRASMGTTDDNGRYSLMYTPDKPGAVPGKHNVRITTEKYESEDEGAAMLPEKVPAKYKKDGALTAEVNPGSNTIDFKLESE